MSPTPLIYCTPLMNFEFCILLTTHGQVYTWGGGARGSWAMGLLLARIVLGWSWLWADVDCEDCFSAAISSDQDLYMFGWNESGRLAQQTTLARPAECCGEVADSLLHNAG